jgi:L-threonylcarbamoyladenylate synthase
MKFLNIHQAAAILHQDGIVAFPTETVYGLGAIATSAVAVDKIYAAKNRPADNPLICHFFSIDQIEKYCGKLAWPIKILFKKFSPGPLSILLNLNHDTSLYPATRGLPSVICRIPDHPLTIQNITQPRIV